MPAKPGHLPPPSEIAEQQRTAYRLHLRRVPHADIAERLGISLATVQRRIDAEREARSRPDDIDVLRQDLAAQLDEEFRTVATVQAAADDPKIKLTASAQLVKINESYRKLFAVDSPTPLEAALTARAELEADLIATALMGAVTRMDKILAELDADAGYRDMAREYVIEGAARILHADGAELPPDTEEPPKVRLAITAGPTESPSGEIDEEGGPSVPHPRRRDTATTILEQARALLEETDDDEDEEDDQA